MGVFLGLPLFVTFLVLAGRRDRRVWAVLATGALSLVPCAAWYGFWSPHLVSEYGMNYFFTGYPLRENLTRMGTPDFWRVLGKVIAQDYTYWPLVPLAAWGGWTLWNRPGPDGAAARAFAFAMPLITLAGVLLLTGRHFSPHTYYLMALVPPIAVWVAAGYREVGLRWPRVLPWAVLGVALSLPVSLMHHYFADRELAHYGAVIADVQQRVAHSDLVLIEDHGSYAWHLHPILRRGWVKPTAQVHDATHVAGLAGEGCRWVLPVENDRYALYRVDEWLARLASN